jgi:Na+/melibiose symporter-like transporter
MEIDKASTGVNQAKLWQLCLFAFNNGATNIYYILTSVYITYYANGVLGLMLIFATTMVTIMRVFDGITDPIIGLLIDKNQGKYGKFRPFMVLGNIIMAVSAILMYFVTRSIPKDIMWLRYVSFTLTYIIYVIGYTFQTACTKSGQTCITNDPKQRPLFSIFNTIASLAGMGFIQMVSVAVGGKYGFGSGKFFDIVVPLATLLSLILTSFAVIGIWEKDRPEFFGVDVNPKKVKPRDYLIILKNNAELRMLIAGGVGTKLAFSIANNTAVACMLYASLMGDYKGLYMPFYIMTYVVTVPFFILSLRTAQKKGQKQALTKYTKLSLIFYVGLLILLLLWQQGNPATQLNLKHINIYTVLFIIFYAIGYGAYYCTADMDIPMVADCADYETYRSGNYVPGIIGTLFSFVDKTVSSLSSTIVGLSVIALGLKNLPDTSTPYIEGMKWLVIILFCVIPMLAWITVLIAMKRYSLTGERMKEIQAVNAVRKDAVIRGMDIHEAMEKWQSIDQVPKEFVGE